MAQMQIPLVFPRSFFSCSTLTRWSTFLECSRGGESRAPTVAACCTCAWKRHLSGGSQCSLVRQLCRCSALTVSWTQVQGPGSSPQGHGSHEVHCAFISTETCPLHRCPNHNHHHNHNHKTYSFQFFELFTYTVIFF